MSTAIHRADPSVAPHRPAGRDASAVAPRICYVQAAALGPLADWGGTLERIARLGFSHLLVSPPFDAAHAMQMRRFDRLHAALGHDGDALDGVARIARRCADAGLTAWLDVMPDYVAADGALAVARPDLFRAPDPALALDPRSYLAEGDVALARFHDRAPALAEWWADTLRAWRDAGIGGFRLASLRRLPPDVLRQIAARLRADAMPVTLAGWTPGLAAPQIEALAGCGLDYVFASLPWWDFRAEWFWTELARLRRVARVLAPVETPFGPRLAAGVADPAHVVPACARAARFASAAADGWLMPLGVAQAACDPMDPRLSAAAPWHALPELDAAIQDANRLAPDTAARPPAAPVSAPGADVIALLWDAGAARQLTLCNADLDRPNRIDPGPLGYGAVPPLDLAPGEVAHLTVQAPSPVILSRPNLPRSAEAAARAPRLAIESVTPSVDAGRFAAKRVLGDTVTVEADVICDGHDRLGVALLWRGADEAAWRQARMRPLGNDRWQAHFPLTRPGRWLFTVEAWRDGYATFRDELSKKHAAGVDVHLELIEGQEMLAEAMARVPALRALGERIAALGAELRVAELLSDEVARLMQQADARPFAVRLSPPCPIDADAPFARFASWYEVFPRSLSDDPQRHGTFADVIRHLPRIRDMGFDVLYFPPIHPIGRTNRKGRNNSLTPAPDDPGSPYAIGDATGGHDAIHPQLGTLEDFTALRDAAAEHGLQLALDFAIQCSPDHPWLKQHREWFDWRPDGSLRYAENPPKKYEDIVNVAFYAPSAVPELWVALCEVVLFWAGHGVRIFRVDNPHTKPLPFWEWLIAEVRADYPDAVFLAEAFTKPKMMNRLGKIGFTQSYTYFTWRNTAAELREYMTELTTTAAADFFRPNFFVNTPDINPVFLQTSGRPGFLIRAALAATLSALWGVYNGFELCEAAPVPGREEYLDSEKYQLRAWDWQRPGNIVAEITALNRLRARNPALHTHLGLHFLDCGNANVLAYERFTPSRDNVLIAVVSFDPHGAQGADFDVPLWRWPLPDSAALRAEDAMTGESEVWRGRRRFVALTPERPFRIWRVTPA